MKVMASDSTGRIATAMGKTPMRRQRSDLYESDGDTDSDGMICTQCTTRGVANGGCVGSVQLPLHVRAFLSGDDELAREAPTCHTPSRYGQCDLQRSLID